jgi:hypothetical protein
MAGGVAVARARRGHPLKVRANGDDMTEDAFNISIRKFLKMVGVSSQREIEHAVEHAIAEGRIRGNEAFPARMRLEIAGLALDVDFDGQIRLE